MDMKTIINSNVLYREADHMLEQGSHEMERAEEDVVTPMICFNVRQSLVNYLRGFLLEHNITPSWPLTLDHLHKQCIMIRPAFQQVDLQSFYCRHEESDECFCLEVHKVEECMKAAKEVQQLIHAAS